MTGKDLLAPFYVENYRISFYNTESGTVITFYHKQIKPIGLIILKVTHDQTAHPIHRFWADQP